MATATYKAEGTRVDYTPGSDVDAGAVIELNTMIGIATQAIADGDKGSLAIGGIFSLPKGSTAIDQGDAVYWTGSQATETVTGNSYLGKCAADAASGDSVVDVVINVNK